MLNLNLRRSQLTTLCILIDHRLRWSFKIGRGWSGTPVFPGYLKKLITKSVFDFIYKFILSRSKVNDLFPIIANINKSEHKKNQNPNKKYVVYTIILGNYDDLKEPTIINPEFDYICFTNRDDLLSTTWKIITITCKKDANLKRCASKFIIYPFDILKKYEISILVGGQTSILCDIGEFMKSHLPEEYSLAISRHPERDCLYEEAKIVIILKKDSKQVVEQQIKKYRKEGMPEHAGLIESGVIIRRHNNKNVKRHCKLWLFEVNRHSQRDQISFPYILWKHKLINPYYFPKTFREDGFEVCPHNFIDTY